MILSFCQFLKISQNSSSILPNLRLTSLFTTKPTNFDIYLFHSSPKRHIICVLNLISAKQNKLKNESNQNKTKAVTTTKNRLNENLHPWLACVYYLKFISIFLKTKIIICPEANYCPRNSKSHYHLIRSSVGSWVSCWSKHAKYPISIIKSMFIVFSGHRISCTSRNHEWILDFGSW